MDIAKAETTEKVLDLFITRRHDQRVKDEGERQAEEAWAESERRYFAERREDSAPPRNTLSVIGPVPTLQTVARVPRGTVEQVLEHLGALLHEFQEPTPEPAPPATEEAGAA